MAGAVRIALIGYGYWGPNYARILNELSESRVTAICEVSPERRQRAQERYPQLAISRRRAGGPTPPRREHAAAYGKLLADLPVELPPTAPKAEHVYHLYVVQLENRDLVQHMLRTRGISTGIHYPIKIHLQWTCANLGYDSGDFPVTERAASRILSLPMYPELTPAQREHVASALGHAVAQALGVG